MTKNFKRRDGKIIRCTSNLAKMNIFEWIYCYFKYWHGLEDIASIPSELLERLFDIIQGIFFLVLNLILTIFVPLILIIKGHNEIKREKKNL